MMVIFYCHLEVFGNTLFYISKIVHVYVYVCMFSMSAPAFPTNNTSTDSFATTYYANKIIRLADPIAIESDDDHHPDHYDTLSDDLYGGPPSSMINLPSPEPSSSIDEQHELVKETLYKTRGLIEVASLISLSSDFYDSL